MGEETGGLILMMNGEEINIDAQSICVHGDNPQAVEFVKKIREALKRENIEISRLSEFIK